MTNREWLEEMRALGFPLASVDQLLSNATGRTWARLQLAIVEGEVCHYIHERGHNEEHVHAIALGRLRLRAWDPEQPEVAS